MHTTKANPITTLLSHYHKTHYFFLYSKGIQPSEKQADIMYDILFDEAFPGGLTLRGPSSAQRCYSLHWAALINISHGSRSSGQSAPPSQHYQVSFCLWLVVMFAYSCVLFQSECIPGKTTLRRFKFCAYFCLMELSV